LTVCVAVISGEESGRPTIYGVMDQMLTSGDIEFEPPQPKYTILGRSLAVMFAGESSLHRQTLDAVRASLAEPGLGVGRAAQIYASQHDAERRRILETRVLAPLGLDWESWGEQRRMKDAFVLGVKDDLRLADREIDEFEDVETLFVGFDSSGPHIFATTGRHARTCDDVGFAAIGAGARHAESYLMSRGYTRRASGAEGMLAAYFAKKRGETAPGVGKATDIFLVLALDEEFPGSDSVFDMNHHNRSMEQIYVREQERARASEEKAKAELDEYLNARVEALRKRAREASKRVGAASAEPTQPPQGRDPAAPQSPEHPKGGS